VETGLLISNVLLWILIAGLALTVLALARQIGVLHERIAPAGALMLAGGPKVGEPAPAMTVKDIGGGSHSIGAAREDGRSSLVFFLSSSCPVCKSLLPVLKSAQKSERDWLEIFLASDGDPGEHRAMIRENGLESFPYLLSEELGMTYRVSKLPFALIIDDAGVLRAKGLVNSREHLESLMEAKIRGEASIQDYLAARRPHV